MGVYFDLKLTMRPQSFPPDEEPSSWITEIHGTITASDVDDDGNPGPEVLAATGEWYYAEIAANSYGLFDILDSHSSEVAEYTALYDFDSGMFSNAVTGILDDDPLLWNPNLLIGHRLEIATQYRGQGITGWIFEEVPRLCHAGAQVMAIKPFPLQYESKFKRDGVSGEWQLGLALDQFEGDEAEATSKLVTYYASFGFVLVPGSGLMVKRIGV